jgi:eukaryotic-like serine/threonine-protein kinase
MGLEVPNPVPAQSVGSYDLVDKIAEGGMGTVYKAKHRDTGQVVAIKIVPATTARNSTLLKRFEREFVAARALDHPNVVKAIEFNGATVTPFLVMEYVDGESLGQRIERDGPLSEEDSVRIIAHVAHGLYRAHKQGLIHRDVKPDNVLITADGQAKLTDLGLVRDMGDDYNLTRTGRGLGTPHFMAPEQFRDAKNADVRCDIYSLGATLYMMVTGQLPFGNCSALDCFMKKLRNELTPPRDVKPDISERVDWAIRRAMSALPENRPSSCREFVEDLYGRSTRPPPPADATAPATTEAEADVWYLVYRDELGETHSVKGATDGIRRALKDGLLGDASNVIACRKKEGPFLALRSYPEFRDLVIAPEPLPTPDLNPRSTPTYLPPASPSGRWPDPARSTPTRRNSTPTDGSGTHPRSGSGRFPMPTPTTKTSASHRALEPARYARPKTESSGRLPHVPIKPSKRRRFELLLWLMVLALAVGTSLAAFYFLGPPQ